MLKVSAVAESISAFSSRWPAELLPSMGSRHASSLPPRVTVLAGGVPDYYRSLSFVISECTRRANISSHDLSMMISVHSIHPRPLVQGPPRMTRHSSLLQFATANAAYASSTGASLASPEQDVLLLLRRRCCLFVSMTAQPLITALQVLPSCLVRYPCDSDRRVASCDPCSFFELSRPIISIAKDASVSCI
jgi:hypothetical protein